MAYFINCPTKAQSLSQLSVSVMKQIAEDIPQFLTELFNQSMSTSHFSSKTLHFVLPSGRLAYKYKYELLTYKYE